MESRIRSVIKTISWRVLATLATILLSYIWLQEWMSSVIMGLSINVIKAVIYYTHERVWNLTNWGRSLVRTATGGVTIWFTGLPSSGKTTIADSLADELKQKGFKVNRLDGDVIRKHLWKELGFSKEDRDENIKRAAYLAGLFTKSGVITMTTFISPYTELRQYARETIGDFVEVYVKCPVEKCIERDVKGMYKKAMAGEIKNFTGISDPYEEPLNPEVLIESDKETKEDSVNKIIDQLKELKYI